MSLRHLLLLSLLPVKVMANFLDGPDVSEYIPIQYHPQKGIETCNQFKDQVKGIYGTFNLTCDCGGVLITAPDTGQVVPITGNFHIKCRSDCFFASPDNNVWWFLYWQADFGVYGLERIRQHSHYVKGRQYKEGRQFYEKFHYLHENEERDCDMKLTGSLGFDNSCQTCEETTGSTEDRKCYHIDCSNVNIGTTTDRNNGIAPINNTCELDLPITDFANHPLAATLGFLQENVQQIYPEGGTACITPLTSMYETLGEDTECTCRETLDYNETDKRAYDISCRRSCVYGPGNGEEVEFMMYLEGLYVLDYDFNLSTGRYHWTQTRHEYVKGRNDTEIFRHIPDRSIAIGTNADECFASQNGIRCKSCGYTSWVSNELVLDCSNIPNGLNTTNWPAPNGRPWYSQPNDIKDVTSWMKTPFAAGLFGKDRVCKRTATAEDIAIVEARYGTSGSKDPANQSEAPSSPSPTTAGDITGKEAQNEGPSPQAADEVISSSQEKSYMTHFAGFVLLGGVIAVIY